MRYTRDMTTNTLHRVKAGDKRKARHDAIVQEMRDGIRQRSSTIPSGKRYNRKVGKRVEA